jgi:hypothetical protein
MSPTEITRMTMILLANDWRAISNQQLTVDGTVAKLTVPTNAKYALIVPESSATGTAIRYWLDGSIPTTTEGIPRGNLDAFDIVEKQNLENFRITQAQAGTHNLQVQYFG